MSLSAKEYNRLAVGKYWNLTDIPHQWIGYQILFRADLDGDLTIEENELDRVDWEYFSNLVEAFQRETGLKPVDGKLGPATLRELRRYYNFSPEPGRILKKLGNLVLKAARVPVSEPPKPVNEWRSTEEKSVCLIWNKYGAAIHEFALEYKIPVEAALAVFFVESKRAYDLVSGLVVIRFEPHIFKRLSGKSVSYTRRGQREEWANLERAFALNSSAALKSCSWGLPQLMGFNWGVTRHKSVEEMVLAFQGSCVEQIRGFFQFVEQNNLIKYILAEDWKRFTRYYNGPGNVKVYSAKIIKVLGIINNLKERGARFTF